VQRANGVSWSLAAVPEYDLNETSLGGTMPEYRLYRLNELGRIMGPSVDIDVPDDAAVIAKAVEINHANIIEVWSGPRLVSRVDPKR
jgi:hypothetical protein